MKVCLDHVAIAVWKVADAPPFLVGNLGGVPHEGGPGPGYEGGQWAFQGGGLIEVIEPDATPDGFLKRFLERRGPGVHHVTFKVPSLRETCDRAEREGYDIVGYSDAWPAWKEAFLHPKQATGIVVQLVESDPRAGDGGSWGPDWAFPPSPPNPPPPVTLVGLRLRARDAERPRLLWGDILRGECAEEAGSLLFRWPGSPLRLAVDLDPDAPEGPVCIELAREGAPALSDAPVPRLGTRFRRI